MRDAGYTSQERSFITLMRVWAIVFLAAAVIFATIPETLLAYISDIGRVFAGWQPPAPEAGGQFWLVLAVALLLVLSYAALMAQMKPLRYIGYANLIILAKVASSAGYAFLFFSGDRQFAVLVGAVVDGLIAALTWRFYARACRSRG